LAFGSFHVHENASVDLQQVTQFVFMVRVQFRKEQEATNIPRLWRWRWASIRVDVVCDVFGLTKFDRRLAQAGTPGQGTTINHGGLG
jgi:hypothetical protein